MTLKRLPSLLISNDNNNNHPPIDQLLLDTYLEIQKFNKSIRPSELIELNITSKPNINHKNPNNSNKNDKKYDSVRNDVGTIKVEDNTVLTGTSIIREKKDIYGKEEETSSIVVKNDNNDNKDSNNLSVSSERNFKNKNKNSATNISKIETIVTDSEESKKATSDRDRNSNGMSMNKSKSRSKNKSQEILALPSLKERERISGIHSSSQSSSSTLSSLSASIFNSLPSLSSLISSDGITRGSNELLTRKECFSNYGLKRYLDGEELQSPPLLYTFPGSGNTWARLLLEHSTGIFTGSVYDDPRIVQSLPGEFVCDKTVSIIKAHPHTHPFNTLYNGGFKADQNKCHKGKIKNFKRVLLLIRNPFDSIWSEFQRRIMKGSHVKGIPKETFPWKKWKANVANLTYRWKEMWEINYKGVYNSLSSSSSSPLSTSKKLNKNMNDAILLVKYEDLRNKTIRSDILTAMTHFLHLPKNVIVTNNINIDRMNCAFTMAEDTRAHRSIDYDKEMSKSDVYTLNMVCNMWQVFGKYALNYGYGLPLYTTSDTDGKGTIIKKEIFDEGEIQRLCKSVFAAKPMKDIQLNMRNEPVK